MADRGGGVFYCAEEKVESMDDAIALAECELGEVAVHKINGVGKKECFRDGIGYMEAAVVIECWPLLFLVPGGTYFHLEPSHAVYPRQSKY